MSSLCILANDQQAPANLEKCMGSPSFIDREEQDTNAIVDKWSPLHSVWSENITKCVYIFIKTPCYFNVLYDVGTCLGKGHPLTFLQGNAVMLTRAYTVNHTVSEQLGLSFFQSSVH